MQNLRGSQRSSGVKELKFPYPVSGSGSLYGSGIDMNSPCTDFRHESGDRLMSKLPASTPLPGPNCFWVTLPPPRKKVLSKTAVGNKDNILHLTLSMLACLQGKEKVNPRGSRAPLMPIYSKNSAMHWTI